MINFIDVLILSGIITIIILLLLFLFYIIIIIKITLCINKERKKLNPNGNKLF